MYRRKHTSWLKHFDFFVLDIFCISFAYLLSGVWRFGDDFYSMEEEAFGIVLWISYFIVVCLTSAYKNILRRDKLMELKAVTLQFLYTFGVFSVFLYLSKNAGDYSRLLFLIAGLIGFVVVYIERILWKKHLRRRYLSNKNLPNLLVVGRESAIKKYIEQARARETLPIYICGAAVLDKDVVGQEILGVPVVANKESYKDYALKNVVDEAFVYTGNKTEEREIAEFFLEMGIVVHIGLGVSSFVEGLPNIRYEKMNGALVVTTANGSAPGWMLFAKRVIDIIGGLVGVIITGILYLFVAPKIKKVDPGPVFFAQERVGKNGRTFKMYKFRSMYLDAEARKAELMAQNEMGDSYMFKMKDDPRILPGIGKFIRDTSIDEFPQFINILRGDMSLVGTRPPTKNEYEQYSAHHKVRLSFRPGLTGKWQISGRSDITDFEEVVRLDNEYIYEWSIWEDIRILWKTVGVVLGKKGSR